MAVKLDNIDAIELVSDCYTDISKYVAYVRAYCSVVDGLKTVYRRTIYGSRGYSKKVKSASIVGDGIKYHPHGDGNIYSALVSMTCEYGRFPLYTGKGNFGGLGSSAAAMRYTEACMNDVARLMYLSLLDYAEYVDGEAGYPEPKYLPALLPRALIVGSGGIPVGLPGASIPQVDVLQLLRYYKSRLKGEEAIVPLPDFGNVYIDQTEESARDVIESGKGKLWFRAVLTQEDDTRFVVTDTTPTKGISHLLNKLSGYIDSEAIDYTDESSDTPRYVFEIMDPSAITPEQLKEQIDRALRCSVTYTYIFVDQNNCAVYCGLDYLYTQSTNYLKECVVRKFTTLGDKARRSLELLIAIEELKKTDLLAKLPHMTKDELISYIEVELGHDRSVATRVVSKPISYLTSSHETEIEDLKVQIADNDRLRDNPTEYLLMLYDQLEEAILPRYEAISHSKVGVVADILQATTESYATLDGNSILVTEDPVNDSSVKYKSSLITVRKTADITRRKVSLAPGSRLELEEDDTVAICPDSGTYLVLLSWGNCSYTVKKLSDLPKSKCIAKMIGGDEVLEAFTTSSPKIEFLLENGSTKVIGLEESVKSRVSRPLYLGSSKAVSWKEID